MAPLLPRCLWLTYRSDVLLSERVLREAEQECGLADRGVADDDEFDEVVDINGSILLANSSPNATLVRVADGHRLHREESKIAMKDAVLQLISEL